MCIHLLAQFFFLLSYGISTAVANTSKGVPLLLLNNIQSWMMTGSCPVAFKKILNPATVMLVVASLVIG